MIHLLSTHSPFLFLGLAVVLYLGSMAIEVLAYAAGEGQGGAFVQRVHVMFGHTSYGGVRNKWGYKATASHHARQGTPQFLSGWSTIGATLDIFLVLPLVLGFLGSAGIHLYALVTR